MFAGGEDVLKGTAEVGSANKETEPKADVSGASETDPASDVEEAETGSAWDALGTDDATAEAGLTSDNSRE